LSQAALGLWQARAGSQLPPPEESGIEHVVVVMMENRSFDHYLGWLPGADGRQEGLTFYDAAEIGYSTYHLDDYQGCGYADPDHSFWGGRVEYNGGACDGWLRAGNNDIYSIGYYTREDLPFLGEAAVNWTVFDRYFPAILGPTFPNRIFQHAGQTDRLDNSTRISILPTIWDRVARAGLQGRYYYGDVPFLGLWGLRYLGIMRPLAAFLSDCATGRLPHVAFVDPHFLSDDDHPFSDIRNGQAFLNLVYRAVIRSPSWSNTVLIINYDEWGGFFDHVAPESIGEDPDDPFTGLRGFRVPCLIISPWSPRGRVSSKIYDHTSILRMIEWRWNLDPLTERDANASNIAQALDFSQPDLSAPEFDVPPGPFGQPCGAASPGPRPGPWPAARFGTSLAR
jgi:phospholipase C